MIHNDLLSKEWCNLIFEGRNKDYGAYQLRKETGKRYKYALMIVGVLMFILTAIPIGFSIYLYYQLYQAGKELKEFAKLKPIDLDEEKEIKIIAAGRSKPRVVAEAPKEVNDTPPQIVDGTPKELAFGKKIDQDVVVDPTATSVGNDTVHNENQKDLPEEGRLLTPTQVVEEMPRYPGGIEALVRFLDAQIQYPPIALAQKLRGQVEVSFLVDIQGYVKEVNIVKHLSPECDQAVLDACHKMPRWIPGKSNGELSVVMMTIPINFDAH